MRIKLRYLVQQSGGLNFIPSVRGPVRKIYTTKNRCVTHCHRHHNVNRLWYGYGTPGNVMYS